jgi:hypothetical protein
VNLWRLHTVPFPDVSDHEQAFDALIDETLPGAAVTYASKAPRWWFLHHLVERGFVLHGSNSGAIEEFEPRGNFDAHNVRHVEGVFASDDAIWPVAVRPRLRVPVRPGDFPLRERTIGFRRGESVRRVAIRHALRPFSRRVPR